MQKFLIRASYTAEGLRALQADGASGRERSFAAGVAALGGKLLGLYFTVGEDNIVAIVEAPGLKEAAAFQVAIGSTGLVTGQAIGVLDVAEMDAALDLSARLRPARS
jgi:uncharacterized protein with GYD domain